MRLKTSLFSHELAKQNFRQVGWISLIYMVSLFFFVVMNVILNIGNVEEYYYELWRNELFHLGAGFQLIFLFLIPVLMAIFILRYLHQKDASDFMHSLPISRTKLFVHHVGFGFIALWLPILLTGLILFIIANVSNVAHIYTLSNLAYWILMSLLILSITFSVSIVVGMLTGISIIQGIFTFIFLFFPAGFTLLLIFNMNFALIGIPESFYLGELDKFSPITDVAQLTVEEYASPLKVMVYILGTIIMLGLGLFLYKKRPVEAATQPIAFQVLKPIFIYSFTFCFTLIGGFYYGIIQTDIRWILFGYGLFSLIGYLISQVIVQKTWRVFHQWREYLYFCIGAIIFMVLIVFDITGFENRIPKLEEIETAYLITDTYMFNNRESFYGNLNGFTDPTDIEKVQALHRQFIDQSRRADFLDHNRWDITVRYKLKNGKDFVREYHMLDLPERFPIYTELINSTTYKLYTEPIFLIDQQLASSLRFSTIGSYKELTITDRDQIVEFIELLRQDVLEEPKYARETMTYIDIHMVDQADLGRYIYVEDERIINWLKQNKLYEQAMITVNDIDRMILSDSASYEEILYAQNHNFDQKDFKTLLVTDEEAMQDILDQTQMGYVEDDTYIVALYLKQRLDPIIIYVDSVLVPDFVTEYFN
ncbi:ABC transporter permease [Amphibacillus sediminis]|uniref:ABC transporter permease n=1 Tax=Amphibacillus sediminis TaxID=360185 RepID=UPI0008373D1D|nr:ABC transporter permease [Amphibacillus sediminis]